MTGAAIALGKLDALFEEHKVKVDGADDDQKQEIEMNGFIPLSLDQLDKYTPLDKEQVEKDCIDAAYPRCKEGWKEVQAAITTAKSLPEV